MERKVYHPQFVDASLTVNSTTVHFDANGFTEELSQQDFDTLTSIPGFIAAEDFLKSFQTEVESELETLLEEALPAEGEAPEETDDTGQDIPEHDEDLSLIEQFRAAHNPALMYEGMSLIARLDLASNPLLTEAEATQIFNWEKDNRKSKRVLNAVDRRLVLIRQTLTADNVTQAMLNANFPREEEK
jgi:hypothetical protein